MLMPSLSTSIKLKLVKLLYLKTINFADIIIVTSDTMKKEAESKKLKKGISYLCWATLLM